MSSDWSITGNADETATLSYTAELRTEHLGIDSHGQPVTVSLPPGSTILIGIEAGSGLTLLAPSNQSFQVTSGTPLEFSDETIFVGNTDGADPSAIDKCVLATPGGSSSSTFSPLAIQRHAARSRICFGSIDGGLEVKACELLHGREVREFQRHLDAAMVFARDLTLA